MKFPIKLFQPNNEHFSIAEYLIKFTHKLKIGK